MLMFALLVANWPSCNKFDLLKPKTHDIVRTMTCSYIPNSSENRYYCSFREETAGLRLRLAAA